MDHAPAYVRHVTGAVYWQDTRGQTAGSGDARSPDDNVFCAIPVGSILDYVPKKDDRIMPDPVADLTPPKDALTIMQIKDFRYGATFMQHIEVTAK